MRIVWEKSHTKNIMKEYIKPQLTPIRLKKVSSAGVDSCVYSIGLPAKRKIVVHYIFNGFNGGKSRFFHLIHQKRIATNTRAICLPKIFSIFDDKDKNQTVAFMPYYEIDDSTAELYENAHIFNLDIWFPFNLKWINQEVVRIKKELKRLMPDLNIEYDIHDKNVFIANGQVLLLDPFLFFEKEEIRQRNDYGS